MLLCFNWIGNLTGEARWQVRDAGGRKNIVYQISSLPKGAFNYVSFCRIIIGDLPADFSASLQYCSLTILQPYINTVIQYYSITLLQHYITTALHCCSLTILVLQYYSIASLQHYNITVLQDYTITALQYYSITVL